MNETCRVAIGIYTALSENLKTGIKEHTLKEASMLHDLGKVLIPSKIINKPARLNKKEREIMNIHSTLGYELLKTQKINEETLDLVKYHHQNLKHSGYPALNCDHHPSDIGVQIISTADKYSALREARVYRRKLSRIESLLILYKEVLEGQIHKEIFNELVEYAKSLGEITNVINSAGVSPAMKGTPEGILKINALGTVYVNQEFSKVMNAGSVIVDVSSNSAYVLPGFIIPKKAYPLAETNEELFVKKLVKKSKLAKGEYQQKGFAYSLSKNFVVWYAKKCAFEYGLKGIRVVSLSPGLIATDMGNLEKEEGGMLIPFACEERMGKPEELGYALATVADERNGYLAGVDVLCDGGSTNGMKEFKKKKK